MDVKLEHPEISEEESEPTLSAKDEAFLLSSKGSTRLEFGGTTGGPVELGAFDSFRIAAASKMGVGFLKWDEDAIREFASTGTYDGMYADAVIVGFLCARPQKMAIKAIRYPDTYLQAAFKWADDNGILPMTSKAESVIAFFAETLFAILESQSEIDPVGSKSGGDSLGE